MTALVAVVALAGCSKEEGNNDTQKIAVKLSGDIITRVVEGPATAGTTTITNVHVFLMNGTTVVEHGAFNSAELSAGTKYFEQVSSSINNVYVLANIPTGIDVSGLANQTAITNYAFTVLSQNPTTGTGIQGKTLIGHAVPATQGSNPQGGTHSTHTYKLASVDLKAITARMEIGNVKAGTGIANVSLLYVWVNNFYTTGARATEQLYAQTDAIWNTSVARGVSTTAYGTPTLTTGYSGAYAPYQNAFSGTVVAPHTAAVYAFHVFDGNLPHVIMLVKGEYKDDYYKDGAKYFLKYVTFTSYKDASNNPITSFAGNTIYKIGVNADGVIINAVDLEDDPETAKVDLGVTVTVLPWTVVNATPSV